MPIRYKNFIIENMEFFLFSVGANCVRPSGLQHICNQASKIQKTRTQNTKNALKTVFEGRFKSILILFIQSFIS